MTRYLDKVLHMSKLNLDSKPELMKIFLGIKKYKNALILFELTFKKIYVLESFACFLLSFKQILTKLISSNSLL